MRPAPRVRTRVPLHRCIRPSEGLRARCVRPKSACRYRNTSRQPSPYSYLAARARGRTEIMWDHGVLIESARIAYAQGAIAGLCGGVAMALAMSVLSIAVGQGPWQLPKRLAGVIVGPKAKDGGTGVIVLGLLMHAIFSAGFGALFAVVVDNLTHEFWMTGVAY